MQERKVVGAKTGQETIPETVSHQEIVKDLWTRYGDSNPKPATAPTIEE
jgi:hypothetical protein